MNKVLILKSGNNCTVTVRVIGSNGLPVNLKYIKSLAVKVAKQGGSTYSITPTIYRTYMTLALTAATELGSAGVYLLQLSGYDANGNAFNWQDQIIEVAAGGADVTTYDTTVVIPGITQPTKDANVIVMDGDTITLEDGMNVVGTGIDSVKFSYPVAADFNATALLSFSATGTTHDAVLPTGFRYIGTLGTEAVSKTYLYTWVRGVLTQISEVKS